MSTSNDFRELLPEELREAFPESRLSIKDKIPLNQLLFYTFLSVNKAILNIKYSEAEITEIIRAEIAMIPDGDRDQQFIDEVNAARYLVTVDVRPEFCMTKASVEYCKRKGIPSFVREWRPDNFRMHHAVFNLLNRLGMLSKTQQKQMLQTMPTFPEDKK